MQHDRPNKWQCAKCGYASQAAATDPSGWCTWCREKATEAAQPVHLTLLEGSGGAR